MEREHVNPEGGFGCFALAWIATGRPACCPGRPLPADSTLDRLADLIHYTAHSADLSDSLRALYKCG